MFCPNHSYSQNDSTAINLESSSFPLKFLEFGLEYYSPSHWNRQIKTININGFIGKEFVKSIGLYLFAGATITHAWGNIIAVNKYNKEEKFQTSAMGIGPVVLVRVQPLTIGRFSFSVDGLGGIILYNKSFPPGGDYYNFMFRLGSTIAFYLGNDLNLNIGLRRMHISNGQGVGSFNPFYEGAGLSLNVSKKL
ncbi:MAG TPA: hypothetical protein DHV28_05710 [Ignavibacteriales bacterium]|nr:hypothetical protein [Ignavibacteriales bacterium]